jgi:hypothetical protein
MEREKDEKPKKHISSNGDGKDQIYLWKFQVLLPILVGLICFLAGSYITWRISETQVEHAKKELEYSSVPKCTLVFVSGSMIRSTPPYFLLTNYGPGRLDSVWLKETVFLLDTGGVHECPDLPHFEYILYCGSGTSMGLLDLGAEKRIDMDSCWQQAFDLFFKKFSGKVLSRFRLTGRALASPEFRRDFFFIIDRKKFEYPKYLEPDEYVGGMDLMDSVIAYTHHGPRSEILYCFGEFFKNPPEFFYVTKDGKYIPGDKTDLPPGTPRVLQMHFSETVGHNSIKLTWSCDEVVGPVSQHFTSPPGVW